MAKSFHISLKGYVGGWDFNRTDVDKKLNERQGKHVDVLIDSLGGSLATGLSISAAFRLHGDVAVHFVGLNASAATIASLGAKHISIDAGAMYLVHKCSQSFFEWGSLNSDQFAELISDCEKIREDLNKIDLNVAQLYAARCKRTSAEMLDLMSKGGWITAQEALAWGFVDEVTDFSDDASAQLTDSVAADMAAAGIPIPDVPLAESSREGAFARFLSAVSALLSPRSQPEAKAEKTATNSITTIMNKTFTLICALLGVETMALADGHASLSDEQLETIENALKEKDNTIAARDARISELEAKLAGPGDETSTVIENSKGSSKTDAPDAMTEFCSVGASASALFNSLP